MIKREPALSALLALALAACQQSADDSNIAIDNGLAVEAADADVETLPPSETSAPAVNEAARDVALAAVIPDQYRGRWGMVAADCTTNRGDAKGLITIGEKTIRFYESTATLKQQRPAIATSFSGDYGFAGEGQTWDKAVTLTRDGDTLQRADDDGRTTYQRCA